MKALPLSPFLFSLPEGTEVSLYPPDRNPEKKRIRSLRRLNDLAAISFDGIDDRETAARYRNTIVKISRDELPPLPEGEYFHDQIIGLTVVSARGSRIGTVTDIIETRSNDIYVVREREKEYLIPAIRQVVKEIDLPRGRIVIEVIEGLLD